MPILIRGSGGGADKEAKGLKNIFNDLPGELIWNLTRMPPNAFYKMPGVTKVTLTNITSITTKSSTNADWVYAFYGCDNLTDVYMPEVTSMNLGTYFYLTRRSQMTNFYAPKLKSINEARYMFNNTKWLRPQYCPALETLSGWTFTKFSGSNPWSLEYPQIKYIKGMFADQCTNLTTIKLDGIVGVGEDVSTSDYFVQNCEQLTTFDFGANIEYMNPYALKLAYSLEKLIIRNPNNVIRAGGNNTSDGKPLFYCLTDSIPNSTWYLYVPDNLVSAYKTMLGLTRVKGLSEL